MKTNGASGVDSPVTKLKLPSGLVMRTPMSPAPLPGTTVSVELTTTSPPSTIFRLKGSQARSWGQGAFGLADQVLYIDDEFQSSPVHEVLGADFEIWPPSGVAAC